MVENKDCIAVQDMLADYSAENLGRKDTARVRTHLAECENCAREMVDLQAAMEMVEDFGALEPPAGLWNGVHNRLTSPDQPSRKSPLWPGRWITRPLGLLASGLVVIFLILGLTLSQTHSPQMGTFDSVADEYVEGHVLLAQDQLFADRINLHLIAAAAGADEATNEKL